MTVNLGTLPVYIWLYLLDGLSVFSISYVNNFISWNTSWRANLDIKISLRYIAVLFFSRSTESIVSNWVSLFLKCYEYIFTFITSRIAYLNYFLLSTFLNRPLEQRPFLFPKLPRHQAHYSITVGFCCPVNITY